MAAGFEKNERIILQFKETFRAVNQTDLMVFDRNCSQIFRCEKHVALAVSSINITTFSAEYFRLRREIHSVLVNSHQIVTVMVISTTSLQGNI